MHNGPANVSSAGISFNVTNDVIPFSIKSNEDRLKFAAGAGNVKMVIMPNGNIGIGEVNPNTFLHVYGTAPEYEILIESPSSAAYGMISNGNTKRIVSLNDPVFGNHFWIEDSDIDGLGTRERIISTKKVGSEYYVGIGHVNNPTQKLEVDGGVKLNTTDVRPICDTDDTDARGTFWFIQGAAGIKDSVAVCAKDAANAYAWRIIY